MNIIKWRLDITIERDARKETEYFNNFLSAIRYAQKITWKETILECHITREA